MKKFNVKTVAIVLGLVVLSLITIKSFLPSNDDQNAIKQLKPVASKQADSKNFTTQDLITKNLNATTNRNIATQVLIKDSTNQKTYQFNNTSQTKFESASILKLSLLGCALKMIDAGELERNDQNMNDLNNMIENSDNDAAKRIYDLIGGQNTLQAYYDKLDAKETVFKSPNFGTTLTTAHDQLLVVNDILEDANNHGYSNDDQSIINSATSSINNAGTFGVGDITNGTKNFKNGWIQAENSDQWIVNSIGRVSDPDTNSSYNIVILTQGHQSFDDGKSYVSNVAKAVQKAIGGQ